MQATVMQHQYVQHKGRTSPMACKLLDTLFLSHEFGLPVVKAAKLQLKVPHSIILYCTVFKHKFCDLRAN